MDLHQKQARMLIHRIVYLPDIDNVFVALQHSTVTQFVFFIKKSNIKPEKKKTGKPKQNLPKGIFDSHNMSRKWEQGLGESIILK